MLFPEVFGRNNFDAFDDFFNSPFDRQFDRPDRMPPHPPVQVMKTDVKETETGYEPQLLRHIASAGQKDIQGRKGRRIH